MKTSAEISKQIKWEKYYNASHRYDWFLICHNEILSEEFMIAFQDKLNWPEIFWSQKLSKKFIKKFKYKFDSYNVKILAKGIYKSENFIKNFKIYKNLI